MPDAPAWGRFAHLRPSALEAIRAATPVAYLPWGALEWHGVHAPTGLDGMQAEGQCIALAGALGGVVLPVMYAGTDTIKPFKGFGHTIEHRAETIRALLTELLDGLADEGWRVLVVVTGHAGQRHQDTLHAAANAFAARRPDVAVRVWTSFDLIADTYAANHAARGEVSLQLAIAPEHVDLGAIPEGPPPTLDDDGVWGEDPRRATTEEGAAMLRLFVERATADLRPLLDKVSLPSSPSPVSS
jgi:creatinine amidohydrolase